jgi:hypothetical protein
MYSYNPNSSFTQLHYTYRFCACSFILFLYSIGFESQQEQGIFLVSKNVDRLWGSHSFLFNGYPHFFLEVMCTWVFPDIKQPGHEVNHSLTSSSEVKNEWRLPLLPLYVFKAWTGKNFTFILDCYSWYYEYL